MKKELIAAIAGTFIGGLMLHYYTNDDKESKTIPKQGVKIAPAQTAKETPTNSEKEHPKPVPTTVSAQTTEPESKPLPMPEPAILLDKCKKILSATGLESPFISARKINGSSWEYTVPITFHRQYECETSTCYDGYFTVRGTHINVSLKYGGEIGANIVKVKYSYLGRKAEGTGECNDNEIIYKYIFTEGPPTGSKAVAKIGPQ